MSQCKLSLKNEAQGMEVAQELLDYDEFESIDLIEYNLKNGYVLLEYPSKCYQIYNVRLIGENIDTIVIRSSLSNGKYARFEGMDFDNYFALTYYSYYEIFEKRTGKRMFEPFAIPWSGYDTENNLILIPLNDGRLMLLNLKTWKEVNIYDYLPKESHFEESGGVYYWNITKVTNSHVYLVFTGDENPTEIKVSKSEIE
jgi:hypothetical protein